MKIPRGILNLLFFNVNFYTVFFFFFTAINLSLFFKYLGTYPTAAPGGYNLNNLL